MHEPRVYSSIVKIHKASQTNIAKLGRYTIGLPGGNRYSILSRKGLNSTGDPLVLMGRAPLLLWFQYQEKEEEKEILPVCRIPEGSVEVKPVAVEANRYLYIVNLEHV